jgi:hypothetical protein
MLCQNVNEPCPKTRPVKMKRMVWVGAANARGVTRGKPAGGFEDGCDERAQTVVAAQELV